MTKVFAGDPAPIEALQWKEMYRKLETATDGIEDVADVLDKNR